MTTKCVNGRWHVACDSLGCDATTPRNVSLTEVHALDTADELDWGTTIQGEVKDWCPSHCASAGSGLNGPIVPPSQAGSLRGR